MAPATTTTTSIQSNGVVKTEQKGSGGDVHLTSADVIQLEHEERLRGEETYFMVPCTYALAYP